MTRVELAAALGAAAASPNQVPEGKFEGRGIVICAGGARLFTCAWVCIGMLRRLGCALPIEVWHLGPGEMSGPMRSLLREFDVHCIDAFEVAKVHPVDRLGGWELKPYALLHSRFREVLLLDADNVPVRDPSNLFEREEFRSSGTIFWPDIMHLSRSNPIWAVAGLVARDSPSVESGQMLLDKSKCWRALVLAHWMNQRSDAFYEMLHGDKDTFLIAWLMLDQPHHLVRHQPKQLAATICQRDLEGAVLFQHRNGAKWILRGANPAVEGFRLEQECFDLLACLERLWDGYVFDPPWRSDNAKALERRLAEQGRFRFVRVSSDERLIELLPDHRIGNARDEFYWYVVEEENGIELVLQGRGGPACRLHASPDGVWRGPLFTGQATALELSAELPAGAPPQTPLCRQDELGRLLERALAAYESLPHDRETLRDFVGLLRALSILDPSIRARLDALATAADNRHGRLIALAVGGWTEIARRPDGGGVAAGHGWDQHSFPQVGYASAK